MNWLKKIGFSYFKMEKNNIILPVVESKIIFRKPAYFEDKLKIKTTLLNPPSYSIEFQYEICKDQILINEGYTKLVFLNKKIPKIITGDGVITDNSNLIPRNTPENTFGVITTYDADFGPGTLQATMSYRYRDTVEIEASNAPFGHMDSINDLSGSISYLWSDNRYRITLYGKNLTDDQELAQGTIAPLTTRGWWTPPRTIGAEFAISF